MIEPAPIEVAQVVTRFIAGAGGVALRGAIHLDPVRFHTTVVTGEGGPLLSAATEAGMDVVVEPALVAPLAPRSDVRALRRLTSLFRERQFDVVHTHSAKAGALGRVAAHRAGTPMIVHTYHGFPFHAFQSSARRAAYLMIERRLSALTDVTLAIGSGVATEALRRELARPESLRTIAPAVADDVVERTPRTVAHARHLLQLPPEMTVVGTVGRLDFQKAPEVLVAALAAMRHRDAHLVWVGGGPGLAAATASARRHGLEARCHFIGERPDVAHLLPAFDVFAMASRYEGLPCAIVEAMRCGVPVVATAVNSVPDLVIPGDSGLLAPVQRPDLLADAIDSVLDDHVSAQRFVRRGRELTAEAFDATRLTTTLEDVYTRGLRQPWPATRS